MQIPLRSPTDSEPQVPRNDIGEGVPDGSRIVILNTAKPGAKAVNLTPGFYAAGRPDLSFDAQRILFVGKRERDDSFSVWEMNVDGSGLRRVTDGEGSCTEAVYLSTMYNIDAEHPAHQIAFRSRPRGARTGSLYTCRMDGSLVRRITFTPSHVTDPFLLSDGRLLFTLWSPGEPQPDGSAIDPTGSGRALLTGGAALLTIHPDGTDVFPFAGVHEPRSILSMPCETPDGWVFYIESDGKNAYRGGSLVAVARTRSLHSRRVVAKDSDGFYHSPSPLPDGSLLISYRPERRGSYGVHKLDPRTGRRVDSVYDAPTWHDVHAVWVGRRPEPAGRSSVVDQETAFGQLYCQDAYLSATTQARHIDRGEIKRLRIIQGLMNHKGSGNQAPADAISQPGPQSATEVVLGEALVEADGSFFLEVPARAPLRLETLNADGTIVQSMRSWMWVMPGERRGCIGCHEDRELTPPNRHALALRKPPQRIGGVARRETNPTLQPAPVESGTVQDDTQNSVGLVAGDGPDHKTEFPLYVGRAVCLECHAAGHTAGSCTLRPIPKHDSSYDLLWTPRARDIAAISGISEPPPQSRLCLDCHGTAADEGPRWTADTFYIGDGVQCESCHGAGSLHVEAYQPTESPPQVDMPLLIERGDQRRCVACHLERPSHREVLELGFTLPKADQLYKTPVNLAISPDGNRLYVVCEDADSVSVVDLTVGMVMDEISVGRRPHDAAVSPDGRTLYVTNRMSDTLSIIDTETRKVVRQIKVGRDPHGVVTDSSGQYLFVLNTGENSVSVIDSRTLTETKRLVTGGGPWSLAMRADGRSCLVTSVRPNRARFRDPTASEVSVIDVAQGVVTGRLIAEGANMLQGIATVVRRDVVLFTMLRTKNLVPMTRLAQGWTITNGLGIVQPDGRIDQVLLDEPNAHFADPSDVAVSPDGRHALVTSGGTDQVALIDVGKLLGLIQGLSDQERVEVLPNHLGMSSRFVVKRVAVGSNPRGVLYSPDGRFAYVANALDDSVTVLDTSDYSVTRVIELGGPDELTEIRWGERLFHSADITFGRQFSCRSCHPDGHINGLTFDIEADGLGLHPVDNRTLRSILDTPPFKWEGTNPSLSRQCGRRLAVFFTRLAPYTPVELQALVRYMCTIELPQNRYRRPEGLTLSQRRGKAVFERKNSNDGTPLSPEQRCATCHSGAHKTNRQRADVGTTMWLDAAIAIGPEDMFNTNEFGELGSYFFIDAGLPTRAFDVPHLRNIYESAPYLHNGAADTLEEIWTRFNMINRHGATGDLTRRQFNDLIAYLKSL